MVVIEYYGRSRLRRVKWGTDMPSNRVELAQYICEIGSDLIPLLKRHGLDATAHCMELAVFSASQAVDDQAAKPPLNVVGTIS